MVNNNIILKKYIENNKELFNLINKYIVRNHDLSSTEQFKYKLEKLTPNKNSEFIIAHDEIIDEDDLEKLIYNDMFSRFNKYFIDYSKERIFGIGNKEEEKINNKIVFHISENKKIIDIFLCEEKFMLSYNSIIINFKSDIFKKFEDKNVYLEINLKEEKMFFYPKNKNLCFTTEKKIINEIESFLNDNYKDIYNHIIENRNFDNNITEAIDLYNLSNDSCNLNMFLNNENINNIKEIEKLNFVKIVKYQNIKKMLGIKV